MPGTAIRDRNTMAIAAAPAVRLPMISLVKFSDQMFRSILLLVFQRNVRNGGAVKETIVRTALLTDIGAQRWPTIEWGSIRRRGWRWRDVVSSSHPFPGGLAAPVKGSRIHGI